MNLFVMWLLITLTISFILFYFVYFIGKSEIYNNDEERYKSIFKNKGPF